VNFIEERLDKVE
jgi:hypothetical protein